MRRRIAVNVRGLGADTTVGQLIDLQHPSSISVTPGSSVSTVNTAGYPSYCSWMPFADFMSECKVPTIAQLQQQSLSTLNPNVVSPDAIAQTQADIVAADQADCAANPEACGQFTFAGTNPTTAEIFGAGTTGQAVGGLEQALGTAGGAVGSIGSLFSSQWAWFALAGVGFLIFMQGRR